MVTIGKVAVSGALGFIGTKLCQALRDDGFEVWPMVRYQTKDPQTIFYDYNSKKIDGDKLSQCTAVIHLAGKNVMSGLWTRGLKQEIYDSRVKSSRFISHILAKLEHGPKVLLNASAVGIYGDRADEKIDEDLRAGTGFMAKLCVDWERSTLFAKKAGIRVVNMRIPPVLDKDGGMLKALLPIFKMGLGGVIGSGQQYMPYITRDELISQIIFLLKHESIVGPVNMVSLEPTTNKDFTKALGRVLNRPTLMRTPAFLLKLLGEQGHIFLASARVYPKVLLDQGYNFADHHGIEEVLRRVLY